MSQTPQKKSYATAASSQTTPEEMSSSSHRPPVFVRTPRAPKKLNKPVRRNWGSDSDSGDEKNLTPPEPSAVRRLDFSSSSSSSSGSSSSSSRNRFGALHSYDD